MKRLYVRCKSEIRIPRLEEEQKYKVWGCILEEMPIWGIKFLRDYTTLNAIEAKKLLSHINKDFGKCSRCDYDKLNEENVECPRCNVLNLNWNLHNPLTKDFCFELEKALCSAYNDFEDDDVKRFWCDGINPHPYDYKLLARSNVERKGFLYIDLWTGVSGRDKYKAKLNFGDKSIVRILKKQSLIECIPNLDGREWMEVDVDRKIMGINLK